MNGNQLNTAAETMEALAAKLETSEAGLAKVAQERDALQAELTQLKGQQKQASEQEAKDREVLAKRASAALLQSGLITTPERAESFAQEIQDPSKALVALHKFAEHSAKAPKTASVVPGNDGDIQPVSSDDVWDNHARQHLPTGA